jgi:putative peptidoglycan lipid II flippase
MAGALPEIPQSAPATKRDWTKNAVLQASLTAVSRVTGFLRDGVVAYFLGTSPLADAYYFAFRIPNLFRRLLGEGAMSAAFIPVFTQYQFQKEQAERDRFVRATLGMFLIVLALVVTAGVFAAGHLASTGPGMLGQLFAHIPGLGARRIAAPAGEPFDSLLAAHLIRWFFPYLFFIGLAALAQACLNAMGVFGPPAASPIVLNLTLITGALTSALLGRNIIEGLTAGVLIGGFLQLAIMLPALRRGGIPLWPGWEPMNAGLKLVLTRFLPGIWGASIYQVTLYAAGKFAADIGGGTNAALYNAGRLSEGPYGIVVIAASTALLPAMARQAQAGDWPEVRNSLRTGLRWLWFLMTPSATLLAFFAGPLITLLLMRGKFDAASVVITTGPTIILALALWGQAAIRLFLAGCYAVGDTRSPALISTLSFVLFLVAAQILSPRYGGSGIAAATVFSTVTDMALLGWMCRRHFGGFGGMREMMGPLLLTILAGVATAWQARLLYDLLSHGRGLWVRNLMVPACFGAGGLYFLLLARLLRIEEAEQFISKLRAGWARLRPSRG